MIYETALRIRLEAFFSSIEPHQTEGALAHLDNVEVFFTPKIKPFVRQPKTMCRIHGVDEGWFVANDHDGSFPDAEHEPDSLNRSGIQVIRWLI